MQGTALRKLNRRGDLGKRSPGGRPEFSIRLLSRSGFPAGSFSFGALGFCAVLTSIRLTIRPQKLPNKRLTLGRYAEYSGNFFWRNAGPDKLNRPSHGSSVATPSHLWLRAGMASFAP